MAIDFRIAVKAFIIQDGKVLVIKRRSNDVHKPNEWDIPGGRLELGENPMTGVKREAKEEVNLEVEPLIPLDIHHFTRDDGQLVTMIIFLCTIQAKELTLSEEHQEYQWLSLASKEQFPEWLQPVIENIGRYIKIPQ